MFLETSENKSLSSEIKTLQKQTEKLKEDISKKLRSDFLENINDISLKLQKDLIRIYKTDKIQIKVSNKRNIQDQIKAIQNWKSQTITSLHSIWMAVDISITINWILQSEWTKENPVTKASQAVYQMLWYYVLEKWYFWWYEQDSGHIWFVENMPELLSKYPSFAKNYDIDNIYNYIINENTIDIKYKKFIDIYQKINNIKDSKKIKYDTSKKEAVRWRLKPINPKTYKLK